MAQTADNTTVSDNTKTANTNDNPAVTTASQQAYNPSDKTVVAASRSTTDTSAGAVPPGSVGADGTINFSPNKSAQTAGSPQAPAVLDANAVDKKAQEIHDAIHHSSWNPFDDGPQKDKVFRELDPLNEADRKALEQRYAEKYGKGDPDTLKKELDDKFGQEDATKAKAILDRHDGRTNDAGQVGYLLTKINNDDDKGKSERELREAVAGLNGQQLQQLDADYKAQFGTSFRDTVLNNKNLDGTTRDALKIYLKDGDLTKDGVDQRTSQDLVNIANIAIKDKNLDLFSEALRGDSPAAKDARTQLRQDKDIDKKLIAAFDPFGNDFTRAEHYLNEGRIPLSQIARDDKGNWFHDDKGALRDTLKSASDDERNQYIQGRELALNGKRPGNDQEKESFKFYNDLHKQLKDTAGSDHELAEFEDDLIRKGSLITSLVKTRDDGGPLGIGSGTDTNKIYGLIENMSEADYNRLKQDPTFRRDIDSALHTITDDGVIKRADAILDRKAATSTYQESQALGRPVLEALDDANGDKAKTLDAILKLAPDEQKKYHDDAQFRKEVDDKINRNENGFTKDASQRLLAQVADGKTPQPDAITQVLIDGAKEADLHQTSQDIIAAFKQDPTLLDRIKNPQSEEDKKLSSGFHNAFDQSAALNLFDTNANPGDVRKWLFSNGTLGLDTLIDLNKDSKVGINDVLNASDADKQRLLNPQSDEDKKFKDRVFGKIDGSERPVVENALKQGKLDLSDQVRNYVIDQGNPNFGAIENDLKQLHQDPAALEQLKNEYAKKYGSSLDQDLINKVPDSDKVGINALLTPAKLDGRQQFYDISAQDDRSHSGLVSDLIGTGGADGNLARSRDDFATALSEQNRQFKELSPERQQQLIDSYSTSLQDYKDSKDAITNKLVNYALVVGSLAAAPFTGGASLALVVAAGAAFDIGAKYLLEGNDFKGDFNSLAKDAIEGGLAAGLSKLGPGELASVFKVGDAAALDTAGSLAGKFGTSALENGGENLLRDGAEQEATKLLSTATRDATQAGGSVSRADLENIAGKLVKDDLTGQARTDAVNKITDSLLQDFNSNVQKETQSFIAGLADQGKTFGGDVLKNSTFGAGVGGAQQIATFPLDYDSSKSFSDNFNGLLSRVKEGAVSGAEGGLFFTGAAKLGGATIGGFRSLAANGAEGEAVNIKFNERGIAADANNPEIQIRQANGGTTVVKPGSDYQIQPGDELVGVKPKEAATPGSPDTGAGAGTANPDIGAGASTGNRDTGAGAGTGNPDTGAGSSTGNPPEGKLPREGTRSPDSGPDVAPSPPSDLGLPHVPPDAARAPGDPFVEGDSGLLRRYHIGADTIDLIQNPPQKWFYRGSQPRGDVGAPVKVHVNVEDAQSLRQVQQALLPALENDPELRKLIGDYKTSDPVDGFSNKSGLQGQDAKGFTIYTSNAANAEIIARKVDQILAEKGLVADHPVTGSAEALLKDGQSGRVVITRDTYSRSVDSTADKPVVNVDAEVARKIEGNGAKLSEPALRQVESKAGLQPNTLVYDSQGKLSLELTPGSTDAYQGRSDSVYATETNTSSTFGQLTDRRALYSLYGKYGADPAEFVFRDSAAATPERPFQSGSQSASDVDAPGGDRTTAVRPADGPPGGNPSAASSEVSVNGERIPIGELVAVGRGADSYLSVDPANQRVSRTHAYLYTDKEGRVFIADAGSTNGTFINGQRVPGKNPDGSLNWTELGPNAKVNLGGTYDVNVSRPDAASTPRTDAPPEVSPRQVNQTGEGQPQNLQYARVNGEPIPVGSVVSVGRGPQSYVKVDGAESGVSRTHAYVYTDAAGRTFITDAGSSNGTFINGERIAPQNPDGSANWREVKPADRVTLGNSYELNVLRPGQITSVRAGDVAQVVERYGVSDQFGTQIENVYATLPAGERAIVESAGIRVSAARTVSDVLPQFAGQTPRGYRPGSTYDSVQGLFDNQARRILIPEYYQNGDRYLPNQDRLEGVVKHEFGHALDQALGNFSDSPGFADAYAQDVARLSRGARRDVAYLLQDGAAGRQEAFAELYAATKGAHNTSGKLNADEFARLFPNSYRMILDVVNNLNR